MSKRNVCPTNELKDYSKKPVKQKSICSKTVKKQRDLVTDEENHKHFAEFLDSVENSSKLSRI